MRHLTEQQRAAFRDDGYVAPLDVMSPGEAESYRVRVEEFIATVPDPGQLRTKVHLDCPALLELVWQPGILDAVSGVLGPDLLCRSSSLFIKESHDGAFVAWHQDSTYWGLSEPDVVTAWVSFSESSVESGAMRMVPGTHREQVAHRDTFAPDNLLSRGQEIMVEVDEASAVDVVLRPGEMSLHHVRMFHGSPPNRSVDRRIGYAIRYIPTHVRQLSDVRDTATLVRGVDAYHHFELEEPPAADLDPAAVARHAAILKRQGEILYRGTTVERFR